MDLDPLFTYSQRKFCLNKKLFTYKEIRKKSWKGLWYQNFESTLCVPYRIEDTFYLKSTRVGSTVPVTYRGIRSIKQVGGGDGGDGDRSPDRHPPPPFYPLDGRERPPVKPLKHIHTQMSRPPKGVAVNDVHCIRHVGEKTRQKRSGALPPKLRHKQVATWEQNRERGKKSKEMAQIGLPRNESYCEVFSQ